MEGEVKGTMYGLSPSGWMDGEIFCDCLERHFLLYAPASRPLLLLLDGHSSHYMADVVRTAASKGVILFCLPPNTIHATQPLEKMCFHALKKHWDDVINAHMTANPGKFVTVYQFNKVFHDAWDKAMIPSTIHSGFKPTGVYPATFLANIHQKERVFLVKMLLNQVVSAISLCIVLMCLKGRCHLHHLLNYCHHFHFHLSLQYHQRYDTSFTTEEKQHFQTRYEEGFDITTDCRYNQWLQKNHHEAISERCQLQFSPLNPEDSLRSSRRGIGTRSGCNRR